jgi:hypothetical protein
LTVAEGFEILLLNVASGAEAPPAADMENPEVVDAALAM